MFYRSDRLPLAFASTESAQKACVFEICGGAVSSFVPLRSLILPMRWQWRCAGGSSGQSLTRFASLAAFLPSLDGTFGGINVCKLSAQARGLGGGLFCHVEAVLEFILGHRPFFFARLIYPWRCGWRVGFRPGLYPVCYRSPGLSTREYELTLNPKFLFLRIKKVNSKF